MVVTVGTVVFRNFSESQWSLKDWKRVSAASWTHGSSLGAANGEGKLAAAAASSRLSDRQGFQFSPGGPTTALLPLELGKTGRVGPANYEPR